MIDQLQNLKGKTKLKFYKNISNYYIEMINKNFQTQDTILLKVSVENNRLRYVYIGGVMICSFLTTDRNYIYIFQIWVIIYHHVV